MGQTLRSTERILVHTKNTVKKQSEQFTFLALDATTALAYSTNACSRSTKDTELNQLINTDTVSRVRNKQTAVQKHKHIQQSIGMQESIIDKLFTMNAEINAPK